MKFKLHFLLDPKLIWTLPTFITLSQTWVPYFLCSILCPVTSAGAVSSVRRGPSSSSKQSCQILISLNSTVTFSEKPFLIILPKPPTSLVLFYHINLRISVITSIIISIILPCSFVFIIYIPYNYYFQYVVLKRVWDVELDGRPRLILGPITYYYVILAIYFLSVPYFSHQ